MPGDSRARQPRLKLGGDLIISKLQSRNVKYIPVSKIELENLGDINWLFQIFFGLSTTSLGVFISVLLLKKSPTYQSFAMGEVLFWVSLICTLVFGITTFLVKRNIDDAIKRLTSGD